MQISVPPRSDHQLSPAIPRRAWPEEGRQLKLRETKMGLGTDFLTLSPDQMIEMSGSRVYPLLTRTHDNPPFGVGLSEQGPGVIDLDLNYDEAIYLLEGDLTIRADGENHVLQPGQLLWMPRGRKIQYVVEQGCKFLYVVSPPSPNK